MDIVDKISLFIDEEISGTPATTTPDVAKVPQGTKKMYKKKDDEEDDEEEEKVTNKKRVKSGTQALSAIGINQL